MLFPVATTERGAPHFSNDWGAPRGQGRSHQGIDVYAAEGTPLIAVDDGHVRYSEEGYGGHVAYLKIGGVNTVATVTYFYGHMSKREGKDRDVVAGDVIGYVGHTGQWTNKGQMPSHCHFEIHPNGGPAINPWTALLAATHVTISTELSIWQPQNPPDVADCPNVMLAPLVGVHAWPTSDPEPWAKNWAASWLGYPLGTVVRDRVGSAEIVGRVECHAPEPGLPTWHKGVTIYKPNANAPPVAKSPPTLSLAAKALAQAYAAAHGAPPSSSALLYPLAQAIYEGTFGPSFKGANNWGSMHATESFAHAHERDQGRGYGLLAHLDSSPSGFYIARFAIYPSALAGAAAFLSLVEGRVGDVAGVASLTAYATALYLGGYYEGRHPDVTPLAERAEQASLGLLTTDDDANIADYAAGLSGTSSTAQLAIDGMPQETGDPSALTCGPPFAPLAARLTPHPEYTPHTLEHARAILGRRADHPPPGGISLRDALEAPSGEGLWLYGPEYMRATGEGGPVTVTGPGTLVNGPVGPSRSQAGEIALGIVGTIVGAVAGVYAVRAVDHLTRSRRTA